jgi:hypothetical protein
MRVVVAENIEAVRWTAGATLEAAVASFTGDRQATRL